MNWQTRQREASYESPSGVRTVFDYENVSREIDKHTSDFNFPGVKGTYIQDLGHSGYRFPMRLFFWGDDHDLEAQAFVDSLLETGIGFLEHPTYGRKPVIPFGTIAQRDDLVTRANQSVIEVTFWESLTDVYPLTQADPAGDAQVAIDAFNTAAATQFANDMSLGTAGERALFKGRYEALKNTVTTALQAVADTNDAVAERFETINDSINEGIDLLIGEPLTLAFQTMALIQAPSIALGLIQAKLDGYKNLANSITGLGPSTVTGVPSLPGGNTGGGTGGGGGSATEFTPNVTETTLDTEAANAFHTNDLFASTYTSGSLSSSLNVEFETKTQAIEAADFVQTQFAELVEWRDLNYQALEAPDVTPPAGSPQGGTAPVATAQIDTGELYQALQEAVAQVTGFLVSISFSLKQERSFVTKRPRAVIDLVAELYGNVDDDLDFFINSNGLTGSEIIEIPAGRTIVYYV